MTQRKHTSSASSTKQIRVGTAHYPPVDNNSATLPREVPYIRLRGIWLINAGFYPGDVIDIRVTAGRLVITRA